jgi:hypothetical protein
MKLAYRYFPFIAGLIVFIVYLTTLAPAVVQFDAGELAAVQATLGIAHPTGYPMFTIIGYIFSLIPISHSKIYQLNFLCAVWSSLAVVVFVLSIKHILENLRYFSNKTSVLYETESKEFLIIVSSTVAGLVLAFSITFWLQSSSVEVYSLQMFLVNLIIYFSLKAYTSEISESKKLWLIAGGIAGLGFTNHLMTIWLFPALLFLFFSKNGFGKETWKLFLKITGIIVLIVVVFYSYFPIRANTNPAINWGNPVDIKSTIDHMSGAYYESYFFAGLENSLKQLGNFFMTATFNFSGSEYWGGEFNLSNLIVLLGLIVSIFYLRKLLVILGLLIITTVAFAINYNIPDINEYFLIAFLGMTFFAGIGVYWLLRYTYKFKKLYLLSGAVILLLITLQVYFNYKISDRSDLYIFEDYPRAILTSLDKNSVLITNEWDYILSPSFFIQHAQNYRTDIKLIHHNFLGNYWYLAEEKKKKKILIDRKTLSADISELLRSSQTYLSAEMVRDLYLKGNFALPEGTELVPDQLCFKIVRAGQYSPAPYPEFKIRIPKRKTLLTNHVQSLIGSMLLNRAKYEMQFLRKDLAAAYIQKIKKDLPGFKLPLEIENEILR